MSPLVAQVAELWMSVDPSAVIPCRCGNHYRLILDSKPILICPRCGDHYAKDWCAATIKDLTARKAKMEEAADRLEDEQPPETATLLTLSDVIGNKAAVSLIGVALAAHRARLANLDGRAKGAKHLPFPHMILTGPPGCGKSTLCHIIGRETSRKIHWQTGQSLNTPSKACAALLQLKVGDILFIDEIHGAKPVVQEAFYLAMENRVVIPVTRGDEPSQTVRLPPFSLIAATTDESKVLDPMLQRFAYHVELRRLKTDELAQAIKQRADTRGWELTADAALMIAERSHGTPRIGLTLLGLAMDAALAGGETAIDSFIVEATCDTAEIDSLGLDARARKILSILHRSKPVRLNVIASRTDLARHTIERNIGPDLLYLGMIEKTNTGWILTPKGDNHLNECKE